MEEQERERERERERKLRIHARFLVARANFHFTDNPSSTLIDFVSARSSISIAVELARMSQLDAARHRLIRLPE